MKHPSGLFRGGSSVRRFLYDGHTLIAEYGATGSQPLRRFVHGPGTDEPIAYFEGPEVGLTSRTYPHQDERGSVVAVANADGTLAGANVYDEYGASQGALTGRFGYTGQVRLPSLGLYYYRARMYDPGLGRFLQTDPIGYGDGMNMYAYVGGDPVNLVDPTGMWWASRLQRCEGGCGGGSWGSSSGGSSGGGLRDQDGNIRSDVAQNVLWERKAWFQKGGAGERLSDWEYTGRYVVNGSWGYFAAAEGVTAQEVREWNGRVLLGEMTVPRGDSAFAALPSVETRGYRTVAVDFRFTRGVVGRRAWIFSPARAGFNLRFDNTQRLFSLGTRTLTGTIGVWNSATVDLPLGTNRITAYPLPISPPTEVRIYGVR